VDYPDRWAAQLVRQPKAHFFAVYIWLPAFNESPANSARLTGR
jgi:hypothetical protein